MTGDISEFKATLDIAEFIGVSVELKRVGKSLKGLCPFHDDKHPSFEVDPINQRFKCWSCGEGGDIVDFVSKSRRVSTKDALVALGYSAWCDGKITGKSNGKVKDPFEQIEYVEEYPYEDEAGKYLSTKVRFVEKGGDRKTFKRGIKLSHDLPGFNKRNFTWTLESLNGSRNLLFHIGSVKTALSVGQPIYLCEGEKAVLRIEKEGFFATCSPEGATPLTCKTPKWDIANTETLKGADIIIVADRDPVGEHHARLMVAELKPVAKSIKVVQAKTTGEKDDAYDHLEAGYRVDDLVDCPHLLRKDDPENVLKALGITRLSTVTPVDVEWLWYPYIPLRRCTLLDGDGDVGKTFMACALAACLTRGKLPNGNPLPHGPRNVLLMMSEDEADDTIVPRILQLGGDATRVFHWKKLFPLDKAGIARIKEAIEALDPILVIVDPVLAYCSATVNINQSNEVRPIFDELKSLASAGKCAMLNIRHTGKSNEGRSSHHAGIGSVDIRNSHRSQLLVRWHEDIKGLRVVEHLKHNLSEEGKAFGYEFHDGEFHWRWDIPGANPVASGPKIDIAVAFLRQYLTNQVFPVLEIEDLAKKNGISGGTLRNARALLKEEGLINYKNGPDGPWVLSLPAKYPVDPFE